MESDARSWDELPEVIIQRIQSFLSVNHNDEVFLIRSSLLSKSWLNAWSTSPALSFRQSHRNRRKSFCIQAKRFKKIVRNTLLRYRRQNLSIEKLTLDLKMSRRSGRWVIGLNKWLNESRKSGLVNIDLHINFDMKNGRCLRYTLPHEFFDTQSFRLRTLNLKGRSESYGLGRYNPAAFERDRHDASTWRHSDLSITASKSLTSLTLNSVDIEDVVFNAFGSKLPFLGKLTVKLCHSLVNVKVSYNSLSKLVIKSCDRIAEVKIDAPKLVYLKYGGDNMPEFIFINISSSKLKKTTLDLCLSLEISTSWLLRIREVLRNSWKSDLSITLSKYSTLIFVYFDQLQGTFFEPHRSVKLKMNIHEKMHSYTRSDLLDAILLACRPNYLSVRSSPHDREGCTKLVLKQVMERIYSNSSSTYDKTQSWQQYLKEAKIGLCEAKGIVEEDENGWRPLSVPWESVLDGSVNWKTLPFLSIKLEYMY